ncbi:MAG: zinc ribbon domain-containing protein [Anaerolineae bacterium]|nr:zinc ribbon domain-containing protein [Anaerolineae bacterium]
MPTIERICPNCGAPYPATEDVCPHCGWPADAAPIEPARPRLPALAARAAVPVALGVATIAARAGFAVLRKLVERALAPVERQPASISAAPSQPPRRPRMTVYFWQRRETRDSLGRRTWEETRARWDIQDE